LVGYRIRLDNKVSQNTRLCFMTTGIMLRFAITDPYLSMFSHVVVDEVHERSQENDFLLALLKNALKKRPDLKVILMSATLSASSFLDYFETGSVINIPGRTFPVTCQFLEDILSLPKESFDFRGPSGPYRIKGKQRSTKKEELKAAGADELMMERLSELDEDNMDPRAIVELVWYIFSDYVVRRSIPGCILIFVQGVAEIQNLIKLLRQSIQSKGSKNLDSFLILPMHSMLTSAEQRRAFKVPPAGVQKIIVSTNIAEASVTIEDVVYVIDSGRMNQSEYDSSRNMSMLVDSWISKANAKQRQGRAGRVREGFCFRMFTRDKFEKMRDFQIPEIRRISLESLFLQVEYLRGKSTTFHQMFKKTESFFSFLIDAPESEKIVSARVSLRSVGALDENNELTSFGSLLAQMSGVDVRIGEMLIYGSLLRCLTPVLLIAAFLSEGSPFLSPYDMREEATESRRKFRCGESDHLTFVRAFDFWFRKHLEGEDREWQFCEEVSEVVFNVPHFKYIELHIWKVNAASCWTSVSVLGDDEECCFAPC
jgi:ATP-dependent RNA helicase DHX57